MLTTTATWLLAFVFISQAEGESSTKNWKKVAPERGDFQILMPGDPKYQTAEVPVPKIGRVRLNIYVYSSKERAFVVMYNDYPAVLKFDPRAALNGGRDGAVKKMVGAKLVEDKEIDLDGVPGLEAKAELPPQGGKPTGIYHFRLYFIKNRLYQVVTVGPKINQNAPEVADFFRSFRLVGDHAKAEENPAEGKKAPKGLARAGTAGPWKLFAPKEGRFIVRMPGKPKRTEQTIAAPNDLKIKMVQYALDSGPNGYIVLYNDLPPDTPFDLEAGRDGAVQSTPGAELIDDKEIKLGDIPGREFSMRVPARNGVPELIMRTRIFYSNSRLHQVMAIRPANADEPPEFDRFLSSFKIVKGNVRSLGRPGRENPDDRP